MPKKGTRGPSIGDKKKRRGEHKKEKAKDVGQPKSAHDDASSKKQKVKADKPPAAAAAAAAAERKPSAYRREHKTIRVAIKAEDGTDTLSEAITYDQQPLLDDEPPDEWVEGGKVRNSKGEERTIHVLTIDNAFEMHPMLNTPSQSKKKSTAPRPTIGITAMKNKFKRDVVDMWSADGNREVLHPFGLNRADAIKRYGKAFWNLYQEHHTKDKAVEICCVYITQQLDARERNQWYSQIQVVRRAGLLDTVVPMRFHLNLTSDILERLEDPTERRKKGFYWNCMTAYIDPKKVGCRSIVFLVNIGKVLTQDEIARCVVLAGHQADNFVPITLVVSRYKIELWWRQFVKGAEADLADHESDVKPDRKLASRIEYNNFFRDLRDFVIECPPIKQIESEEDCDSAGEDEAIEDEDDDAGGGYGQNDYKSLSISDANRLYWFAWDMAATRYDCWFSNNEMKRFREMIREKYIKERGVCPSEVEVKLQQLELIHYCFIMLVSQNMDDEFCRNSYYRLMKEGLYDVEAVVGMLARHSYEQVQKYLANVHAQEVPGLGNQKSMSLLDFCVILRVVYNDKCPTKLMYLLAFPQVAEKKARVTLNGFGIIDEYGKDGHVLRMERIWGVNEKDLEKKYHGDYNDVIGEACQHLNRGLNDDLSWRSSWAELLFDRMMKKDPSHRAYLQGFERGYPTGGSGKNTKAYKMEMARLEQEEEGEATDGGDNCRRSARLSGDT